MRKSGVVPAFSAPTQTKFDNTIDPPAAARFDQK